MTPRDLDEIKSFLTSVGRGDLFEYFGIPTDAPDDDVEAAIKKRRTWAQGQQSNPKYRQEALWVIKNIARCRRAMVDDRIAYMEATRSASQRKALEILDLFIQGNLTDGLLTERGERAILQQGRAQGLPDHLVTEQIERALTERGARRATDGLTGPFVDHYGALGVRSDAAINELERAYRDRYHAARQLPDPTEAERVYGELDAAWEVLRNPGTRARYDERRRSELGLAADSGPEPTPTLEPSAPTAGRLRLGDAPDADGDAPAADDPGGDPSSPKLRLHDAVSMPAGVQRTDALGAPGNTARPARPRTRPQFEFDETDPLPVPVTGRGGRVALTVRRTGTAPVSGRVFADREWVSVTPEHLDPEASEQEVVVQIDATAMGRTEAVALVTIAADDGSRTSVTLAARKRTPWLLYVAGTLAICGGIAAAFIGQPADAPDPTASAGTLVVAVDPPAGQIFVDGDLVSTSGELRMDEGLAIGEPLRIRVEQDGFTTWSGERTLTEGQETRVEVDLELADPMEWMPDEEDVRVEISSRDFARVLSTRSRYIDGCYQKHLTGEDPGFVALTTVSLHVSARGWVVGARIDDQNHEPDDALWLCLKRHLRSIKVPIFTGDYAVVKHQFRYSVPGTLDER